jgi:hypothetical protein
MKITGTKGPSATSKSKKSSSAGKASGVSFDAMVEKAGNVDAVESVESADAVSGVGQGGGRRSSYIPQEAEARGEYMITQLEQLERDILTGRDASAAMKRLQDALATEAIDRDGLSPELLTILDEIEMRVSIEVAKVEAANKKPR